VLKRIMLGRPKRRPLFRSAGQATNPSTTPLSCLASLPALPTHAPAGRQLSRRRATRHPLLPALAPREFEFEYYRWSLLGLTGHSPDHHT